MHTTDQCRGNSATNNWLVPQKFCITQLKGATEIYVASDQNIVIHTNTGYGSFPNYSFDFGFRLVLLLNRLYFFSHFMEIIASF